MEVVCHQDNNKLGVIDFFCIGETLCPVAAFHWTNVQSGLK